MDINQMRENKQGNRNCGIGEAPVLFNKIRIVMSVN